MKIIVCVDDNNGMMFNNRRQSRDRVLVEDIVKNVIGGNLLMAPYSDKIDEFIIYRWNRSYPADMHLDIDPAALSMKLVSTTEFAGSSHKKSQRSCIKDEKMGNTNCFGSFSNLLVILRMRNRRF